MPSLDHLLGLSLDELRSLSDEQLLENYKEVFNLEPQIPIQAWEEDDAEDSKPKVKKGKKKETKMSDLKNALLKEEAW